MGGDFARTGLPNAVTTTAYNANSQLTTWGTATLSYDLDGNLTSDGTNTLTWNARNKPASIAGGATASFAYDPFGRRTQKSVAGTSTTFLYDGANVAKEVIGGTNTANLLSGGIDEVFKRTDAAGTSNFLGDALGSTVALTDGSGNLSNQYTYEPFGNARVTGSVFNPYQYTGRENDGTGVLFYRARYYNPTLQRFISEDPIGFKGGGACLYAYAHNSPTNQGDPSGLCPIYVGHRPEAILPTEDPNYPSVALEHTFLVLGGRKDKERTVLESEPSEDPWFWNKPKIYAEVYPLIPGLDPKNPVWTDPEIFVWDDGLPCSVDAKGLQDFAKDLNNRAIPYKLLGPNSNSVVSAGLNALGIYNWPIPILAPGWNSPIPH